MGETRLLKILKEFGSRSSIHGVCYTLDRALSWLDRIFWLLLFLSSIALAGFMISTTVQDWQDRQFVQMEVCTTVMSCTQHQTAVQVTHSSWDAGRDWLEQMGAAALQPGVPGPTAVSRHCTALCR